MKRIQRSRKIGLKEKDPGAILNCARVKPCLHVVVTIAEHAFNLYALLSKEDSEAVNTSIANISCEIWMPAIITTM